MAAEATSFLSAKNLEQILDPNQPEADEDEVNAKLQAEAKTANSSI